MKPSVRFSPTVNGNCHLGHCYMALVNQAYAKERGWQFNVRFDDNQHQNAAIHGIAGLARIRAAWEEDLAWLDIHVDNYSSDQELHRTAFCLCERRHPGLPKPGFNALTDQLDFPVGALYYPYAPEITALKVVMDHLQNVQMLIRGDDLLTEFALYRYFEDLLYYQDPIPQLFLPRLKLHAEVEPKSAAHATEISKTIGNFAIRQFRANGFTPGEVRFILASSCLLNSAGDWTLANLKPQPIYEGPYVPKAK
jgi:glutamyl/glutaminyl-tRNA synthetase